PQSRSSSAPPSPRIPSERSSPRSASAEFPYTPRACRPSFSARAAPHPNPLPAANPHATGGERGFVKCELDTTWERHDAEIPSPRRRLGVGGGERARVRGGSRGPPSGSRDG